MGRMAKSRANYRIRPRTPCQYTNHQLMTMVELSKRGIRYRSEAEIPVKDEKWSFVRVDLLVFGGNLAFPVELQGVHHYRSAVRERKDRKKDRLLQAEGYPSVLGIDVSHGRYSHKAICEIADQIEARMNGRV